MNGSSTKFSEVLSEAACIQQGEVLYAAGYVRHFLETYSRSSSLPADELAGRVAELLLAQTGREILGPKYHLPTLRHKATKGTKAARKVAVVGGTHRPTHRPMSKSARRKIGLAQKKRWAEFHARQSKKAA